jgi:hypothetical protein
MTLWELAHDDSQSAAGRGCGEARLEAEASMLAVARADIEHGRYIADGDVDAWLAAWESGEAVELPEASASSPRP